jgi:methanogenic corrinoid protein MtbC1
LDRQPPVERPISADRPRSVDRPPDRPFVPRLGFTTIWRCRESKRHPIVAQVPPGVSEFGELVLGRDEQAPLAFLEQKLSKEASLDELYLDLLAPTARFLGGLWDVDACDFTAVTLGLCRLHRVLRELDSAFVSQAETEPSGLPVLLVPAPGEQHMFGLLMVAEFFRRAGWNVWSGSLATRGELAAMVRNEWFAVVGFSLSCESRLDALASAIQLVRRESCNRSIGVLVGGHAFTENPDLVSRVGADAMAVDARQAPLQAQSLVAALAQRN